MKPVDVLPFEQALEFMPDEFHPYAIFNSRSKQVKRFAKYIADEETYICDEPIQFESEKEAFAFCAGIRFGIDMRMPVERLPLRSFEKYDKPFIKEIRKYI